MKTKQTALDILFIELSGSSSFLPNNLFAYLQDVYKKAKEIEKEQIVNAFISGDECENLFKTNSPESAEEYYNKTYGKSETKGTD